MKLGKQSNIFFETSTDEESESDESSYVDEESYTSEESSMEVMGIVFQQPQAKGSSTSKEVEVIVHKESVLEERLRKMLAKDLTKEEEEDDINMFKRYPHLFITDYSMIKGVNMIQHHIDLKPNAKPITQKLRRLGVVQQEALLSEIFGHSDDRCWYNPNFRGRIPEHVKQEVQAPAVNEVRTGDNQPRPVNFRNWNNRGLNQIFRNQGGWMNQGNQNFQAVDANAPCNYCGASGHRQGPDCSLWCKHRTERGIPIIRYSNKPESSQQPPVQLNAVILEEMEVGTSKKWMNEAIPERSSESKLQTEIPQEGQVYDIHHFQCDCTKCVNANNTEEKDKAPKSMVVTRSGVKGETAKHSEKGKEKFLIDWGEQDQVRKGVMKEINRVQQKQGGPKIQKQVDTVQKTDFIGQHSGSCQAPEQSQSIPAKATITLTDEFCSTLMDAPNQMSLRQILSLVPNFAHQFMQRLAQEYGFSVEQKKAWGEEVLKLVSKVFGLQQGEENHDDRASEQIMDREFGKCEGTRGENYAIISAAEQGKNFGWANMLYDRKKIREDIKEDDTQERVKGIYDDLLIAGYSHEICMDTLNLKKSELTDLPPSGSKSVKKVLRIKKRKVAEMASDADQEPVGQQSERIQTANSNFEDIPYARCLESVKLIGDYVGQQRINSNLLINDNEKLKREVAYLKLEMKNKTVSDEEVNAIKTKLRSTESQLECALKKINFYSEQMHRRESSARIYKEWMMEWDNIFHQQLEVLSTVNVTLEAENKVLLDRVSACKEVEKKIKECAEDDLEIEGCFMSGTDVDTMKMELQKHLEPIWTEMKEKLLEVSSRPYKEFAEEENKEEYMLLQTQYTDLQEKYNMLLKKQLEADQSTEDFKVLEDQQEPCEEMEKTPDNKNLNVLFAGLEQTCAEELKSVEDVAEESIQSPKEKTGPDSLIKQDFQPTRLNFEDQVPEEGVSESAVAECDDNKIQIIVNESEVTTQDFLADIAKKIA
ncbi:hypothetical protein L7F22_057056 [Adiantum nelumboides]|nr:hypothetical protein [Adiantum nelumboides]